MLSVEPVVFPEALRLRLRCDEFRAARLGRAASPPRHSAELAPLARSKLSLCSDMRSAVASATKLKVGWLSTLPIVASDMVGRSRWGTERCAKARPPRQQQRGAERACSNAGCFWIHAR